MISRRHVIAAATVLWACSAWAEPTVGLAERRAIAAYRESRYPAQEKAIREAAGSAVPVEVAWDQLAMPGDAQHYADPDYFEKTIFEPLVTGLKEIGKDKIGREALQAKLKAIRIRYDEKTAPASNYANGLTFENGVLDVNWRPFANVADFKDRVEAVTAVLEKTL